MNCRSPPVASQSIRTYVSANTSPATTHCSPSVPVISMIQQQPKLYAMEGPDKLRIRVPLPGAADRFNAARALLATLAPGP